MCSSGSLSSPKDQPGVARELWLQLLPLTSWLYLTCSSMSKQENLLYLRLCFNLRPAILSSSSWWDIFCLRARSSLRARFLGPFRVDPRWLKEALFWHNVTQLLRLPPTHLRFWGQINCKSMSAQDYIEQVFLGNVFEQDWWIARSIDMSYNVLNNFIISSNCPATEFVEDFL